MWELSNAQVDVLRVHVEGITKLLLDRVDSEFRFSPQDNWVMLTHHLIELLQVLDREAFAGLCQLMVNAMLKVGTWQDPFLGASLAQIGATDNKVFESIPLI